MNLSSYLARTAMANTEALGRTEMAKQRMQNELALKQEEAQGQAIGGLTGAVLGAGVGAYQKYNEEQESHDALQGFEARKEYGTLTDNNLPVGDRISQTYGQEAKGLVDSRTVDPNMGPMTKAYSKGVDRSNDWRSEAAAATGYLPRVSQTGSILGGRNVEEVANTPTRDFEKLQADDMEKLFLSNDSTYDRLRGFSLGRTRRF